MGGLAAEFVALPVWILKIRPGPSVPCSQEAIALLMACRRFGIEGADATIRKMLPLVFSRDPGDTHSKHDYSLVKCCDVTCSSRRRLLSACDTARNSS